MTKPKAILIAIIALVILLIGHYDLHTYLSLTHIQSSQDILATYKSQHPVLISLLYILIYIATAALSIPGATILTLLGGALFGAFLGTIHIAIGASLGATLAFLSARFIFRDTLESKYAESLSTLNKGIEDGALNYVLFLRLVPLFPFFLVNILLGLTRLSTTSYFLGSLIGMLPGIFVYANAGSQLSSITSTADIASPGVLGAFALLGLFALIPILYKKCKTQP